MPNWTKEQLEAIHQEGKNIIVSAGAGSGKTAVLTERVLRKLKEKVHINELLILTFTNAAANEMKERIRKAISKEENLKEELDLIDSAYICTFDSFALSIVKKYHTTLNITNNIKVTDEVTIDLIKKNILESIFEKRYLSPKQSFSKLIKDFCLKDDKDLKNYILNIYKKIELKYDKTFYLENYENIYFSEENLNSYIKKYENILNDYKNNIINILDEFSNYFDSPYVEQIKTLFSSFLQASSYEKLKISISSIEKIPPVPRGSSDLAKAMKANLSELVKELKEFFIYDTKKQMIEEILETKEDVLEIISILKEFDDLLREYKLSNNVFNFTDIAHLSMKVVKENKDVREELTDSFNEILIDEYQDTSDLQEEFVSLISKNNIYMVGDIKQSIYQFRNANPYIFKSKYDDYSNNDDGIKIDLNKNFRSRQEVLNNINLLFNLVMDDEVGGADYRKSHQMIFGNNLYLEEGKTDQEYNIEVLTYHDKKDSFSKEEQEIFIIANDIKQKMNSHYKIFDKDTKTLRNANYSDFVILIDKSKSFDLYKKIFEYLQIPLTILKDETLTNNQDVLVIKNLLKLLICIKNGIYDEEFKYNFVSIARSFLFRMNDKEIYDCYIKDTFLETELYKKCLNLVGYIDNMCPSQFLQFLLEEFEYDEKIITIGNMKSVRIREEYLWNLLKNYESLGNTIYNFVDFLEEIYEEDFDLRYSFNNFDNNSCKIMTIHKSKGLEFPICYFAGFYSRFHISELKEKIIYDKSLGIIIPKVNEYYKDTILKMILKKDRKKEEISERIRLLYVALTRAKEKMIIVVPEMDENQESPSFISTFNRLKYNSFQSILKSIYSYLLPYVKKQEVDCTKEYQKVCQKENLDHLITKDQLKVSNLVIENEEIEEKHFSKDELHLISKEESELLSFGTKVHECLEQMDFFNYDKTSLNISEDIKEKIEQFINSKMIQEHKNSKVYKEYEFLYEEGNEVYHGIIDLMLEQEDKIIIIDYKLKNIENSNYDKQLNGYRKYIEQKTNKIVECYLYSIMDNQYRKIEEI